jgi:hypothetical protein
VDEPVIFLMNKYQKTMCPRLKKIAIILKNINESVLKRIEFRPQMICGKGG